MLKGDGVPDEPITFAELERKSAELARGLIARGVGKGTRVGFICGNGPSFAVQLAAIARIGAIAIPISTMIRSNELVRVLRQSDVSGLIVQRKLLGNDAWERTLKRYVEENRYRWVTARTLTDLAAQESKQGKKVADLRAHWWEQTHGDDDLAVDLAGAMEADLLKGLDPELLKQMEEMMKTLSGP